MNTRDLLFALLRFAIKGEALDISAIRESLKDKKPHTLFKVAKNHDMAHLMAYALEQNNISLDTDEYKLFAKKKEQALLRYEMIQADIKEICSCFDNEHIDYILLKGAEVRQYYPQAWMRTSCDIDILVREECFDNAIEVLVGNLGYRVEGKKTFHDISLYSPFGMHLELHHNIKETVDKYDKLLIQVWDFSEKQESCCQYKMKNEFLFFHLIAHMAYHFVGGGCGLRSVLDIWILNQKLSVNEEQLNKLLKEGHLLTFYESICELGELWFDCKKTDNDAVLEMEKYILLGGMYGTKKQTAVSKQVKKGGKFKYFWSRIFMPYKNLAILYPIIKKYKILTPFCQIARWFGVIFKIKKIKTEIGNVIEVTDEQTIKMEALLNYLNI